MVHPANDDRPADALEARRLTQEGRTGDKIPGIDPAAAPMETDQEAGADANPAADIRVSKEPRRPSQTSAGDAMRRPAGGPQAVAAVPVLGLAAAVVAVIAAIAVAVVLLG